MPEPDRQPPVITASEVGHYAYCRRAWWLRRVQGVEPDNLQALQRGLEGHEVHGQGVRVAEQQSRLARGLALIAVLCALGLLLLIVLR